MKGAHITVTVAVVVILAGLMLVVVSPPLSGTALIAGPALTALGLGALARVCLVTGGRW